MLQQDHRVLFRSGEAFTRDQKTKCPVCGHRTVPLHVTVVRRSLNWLLVALLGASLMYIALDVAHDGRLDGSVFRVIGESRQPR